MIALWWIGPCNEQFLKSAVVRLCFHYQAPAYIVTPTWVSSLSVGYLLGRRKRNSICIPETGISAPSLVKSFSGGVTVTKTVMVSDIPPYLSICGNIAGNVNRCFTRPKRVRGRHSQQNITQNAESQVCISIGIREKPKAT